MKTSADKSDMASLSGERSEPRTAITALAKVSWRDTMGTSHAASVTIEDTSTYGACIRTKAPILIGSRLRVDWRGGSFFGVAKYCRSYRDDFIVGIRRERDAVTASRPAVKGPAAVELRRSAVVRSQNVNEPPPHLASPVGPAVAQPAAAAMLPGPVANPVMAGEVSQNLTESGSSAKSSATAQKIAEQEMPQSAGSGAEQPSPRGKKMSMLTKWLHRSPRREQKNDARGNFNGSHSVNVDKDRPLTAEWRAARPTNRRAPSTVGGPGALLQLEDIYRAKGIIGLKMGYSIQKVAEMLSSAHVRELPNEMKRASVLMALDVAGIRIEDVLEDAERRLDALNSYEADQDKYRDEYEARKMQENAEVQAEMERVLAHYQERLKSNTDDVAQLRSPFCAWQEIKQQEVQRITEAVVLCAKRPQSVSAGASQALAPAPDKSRRA